MILNPVEVLDVLGNENRRRILRLLSFRPFYFNEIARRLDVGPKAVIAHLEMLERAGLVECYTEDGRRKYFKIARNLVLEVAVSPNTYGIRAHAPEELAGTSSTEAKDLGHLRNELYQLEERRQELRTMMDEMDQRAMAIRNQAVEKIHKMVEDDLQFEVLLALLSGLSDLETLSSRLEVPPLLVEDSLKKLEALGAIQKMGDKWSV